LGTAAEDAEIKASKNQQIAQSDAARSNSTRQSTASSYELLDRFFHEQKLGMSITECRERLPIDNGTSTPSRPQVNETNTGGEAAKLGIRSGDIIISLNDSQLQEFQDFYDIVPALERPVKITFFRFTSSATSSGSAPAVSDNLPSLVSPGTMSSIFNFRGNLTGAQPSTASSSTVPEDELRARREERLRAVSDRSNDKKFTKKNSSSTLSTGTGKKSPVSASTSRPVGTTEASDTLHSDTQRAVERVKAEEHRVERSLGYNPFRPHMSFTGNAATAATVGMSTNTPIASLSNAPSINSQSSATVASFPPLPVYVEEDEDIIAEVDDAFAMLLSLTDAEQDSAKIAVQTVQKMLLNLYCNKQEPKFRTIRMTNKAFNAKVGSVPGGVELLLAAGYRLEVGDVPETPYTPISPTGAPSQVTSRLNSSHPSTVSMQEKLPTSRSDDALNDSEARDSYLLHLMDEVAERKLNYTVSRLQELLDMQSRA
jgi:hypothetical protein